MSEYIQSIDGMNSGEFDTLFVDDLTANTALFSSAVVSNNLTVQGDLIVEGDQIFTGNQTIEGSLTVDGTGTFSGPLTSGPLTVNGSGLITGTLGVDSLTVSGTGTFSGPTKIENTLQIDGGIIARGGATIESYLTSKNIASFDNQETRNALDVGSNAPFFEILLSPSAGTPSPSGSWTYTLTTYYSLLSSGYDFDFMIATTGGPASTPLLLEIDVNGDIVETRSLFIPRNGLLKVRLSLEYFQAGANNVFLNLATATSGPNWASFSATLWRIDAPDLRITSSNDVIEYRGGPSGTHRFTSHFSPTTDLEISGEGVVSTVPISGPSLTLTGTGSADNLSANALRIGTSTLTTSGFTATVPLFAPSYSGTGANLTFLNAGNISSGLLPVARGGTNAGVLTANKLMVGQGTNGVLTPGNLHWDNLNTRLGIITATPNSALDVNGTIQATRMGLGHTTVAPVARLEVISNVSSGLGGVIADFEDGLGVSRVQIVDDRTIGSIPAGIKNVGDPDGIGVWATAGPIKILTGTGGTDALVISQAGNGTLSGSLSVGTTLTVGGTGINNAWVRSLFTGSTGVSYNSATGVISANQTQIRGFFSGGTGINYNSTTGVITNSLPSQWSNFGSTGIFYTAGRVGIGTSTPQTYPLTTAVNLEGGFDPSIALNIENLWTSTSNANVYARFKAQPLASEWLIGMDESSNFDLYNTSLNEIYTFAANGTLTVPERLWVGDPTYRSSTRPFEVGYLSTSGISVGALFNNHFNGSNNYIQVSNRNTTTPAFQNSAYFGVSSSGEVEILEELGVKLLSFNPAGMASFTDDISIRANPGAWDTTTSVAGLHFRYSTNGTQDEAYIQSVIRSTEVLKRLVIQGSEVWVGSAYDATSIANSRGRVNIFGPTSTAGADGGHMNFFTSGSDYPTMSLFNWSNDNCGIFFDTYYTTAFTSADAGSNFMIYKFNDRLDFSFNYGTAPGTTFTRRTGFFLGNNTVQFLTGSVGMTGTLTVAGNATCNSNLYGEAVQCNWNTGRTIAGATSRLIASAPIATEWIGAFNATDASTGVRGVIFTRTGTIIGAVRYDAGAVAYLTTSDYRIKKNIRPYGCGLGIIRRLKPCKYEMVEDDSFGEGFIAHQLQEVLPHAVSGEKDAVNEDGTPDHQSIDKMAIIAPLVVATQQLDRKVSSLETSVQALGAVDLTALQTENALLKERLDTLQSRFDALLEKLQKSYVI